ncbi:putative Arginine methyltransferase pam1 [Monocercomonoides exilis]|uniref:putative Arginine methyltransferase pam1 n=1 Tax=Monocercomonoides exilis TaxID=2049356 RepID=UPI00355A1B26|nr:putative Arginine methyltransferase pam1 [Monocercomonoides exilis]|eukprot:MONOS_2266.1-p1 / transcript=MONOS_2266.1 / gene=MONOS_2266 / organism=Monocercomonoides_exilis_PA203 / gene_product=Arginine methyltransferase pam1 / transcript_product=Arginine methyltransferase pam1 / location=Mono_scaffold00045:169700-170821(-) / protein_length=351 / sequence_SO=supercontig / SO=protein_coding / is_pseudo=false
MATPSSSSSQPAVEQKELKSPSDMQSSDYYFESYAHFGIHEEMLKDEVRTRTYRDAIIHNPQLFRGKIVLDVGCGTGILSMFAVQAGASHVFAIDCSAIIESARSIVEENGFKDQITLIRGKVEELDLPVDKVDIIVSEWMGYCLLYENMLESVLVARDRWLKPDGILLPDVARMMICGIEDAEYRATKIDFWDNVYGFKMSCLKKEALQEPLVDICDAQQVMTDLVEFRNFDLKTVKKEDLAFKVPFALKATRHDTMHAAVVYFDVMFTHGSRVLTISTSPLLRSTHWKQTVFYIPTPMYIAANDGIVGTFELTPNEKNRRDMDINIEYEHRTAQGKFVEKQVVEYKLR